MTIRITALSLILAATACTPTASPSAETSPTAAAQEAPHQVGHGADLELVHDVGAVRLHRLDADAL